MVVLLKVGKLFRCGLGCNHVLLHSRVCILCTLPHSSDSALIWLPIAQASRDGKNRRSRHACNTRPTFASRLTRASLAYVSIDLSSLSHVSWLCPAEKRRLRRGTPNFSGGLSGTNLAQIGSGTASPRNLRLARSRYRSLHPLEHSCQHLKLISRPATTLSSTE